MTRLQRHIAAIIAVLWIVAIYVIWLITSMTDHRLFSILPDSRTLLLAAPVVLLAVVLNWLVLWWLTRSNSAQPFPESDKVEKLANLQKVILDNIGKGVIVLDQDEKTVLWNRLAVEFTGLTDAFFETSPSRDQYMQAQTKYDLFDEKALGVITDFQQRVAEGERDFGLTYERIGTDGKSWVEVYLHAAPDGTTVRTFQDITERKNFELELLYARETAEEQARLLRLTLDNIGQGILVLDQEARVVLWNNQVVRFSGIPESLLMKQPTRQEMLEHEKTHFYEYLDNTALSDEFDRRIRSGERDFSLAFEIEGQSGESWVEVRLQATPDGGRIRTYQDITERKKSELELQAAREKAEKQALLQQTILDNIGQGIVLFDRNGRTALWNNLATEYAGVSEIAPDQQPSWDDFLKNRGGANNTTFAKPAEISEFNDRLAAGERNFVVFYKRRDLDGEGWVQVALRSLTNGMKVQTFQDITELQRAIDGAQAAQRAAEEANKAKSNFLSNMSHELRTPLNAIIGFTEYVTEDDRTTLTEEQQSSLSQVLEAGKHLLALINDVLDLSKIEAGAVTLSMEPVDPYLAVDECISLTASSATDRNTTILNTLQDGIDCIEVDRIRFKQAFLNLLSNAVKYNRDPGHVVIEYDLTRDNLMSIGVRDEGPGIPADQIEGIFNRFDRLGAENGLVEGTGIGLTITKSLIERMGGTIRVESEVGKGSVFWLDVPLSSGTDYRRSLQEISSTLPMDNLKGKVLYVEDNSANMDLVRKILSRFPAIEFMAAVTGKEGLERAVKERPEVILLDINIPVMDGYEVLKKLNSLPDTRHIPVIALTAAASDEDIRRGQTAGFFSYLTKPVPAKQLMRTIGMALSHREDGVKSASPINKEWKVLVVDDVHINLLVTQKQLSQIGISADTVDNPSTALDMLASGAYQLAFVDIGMREMNGMDLTRQLRLHERDTGGYTPVIALTASYCDDASMHRYREAGMDGQLSKPASLTDLMAVVRQWLQQPGISQSDAGNEHDLT